MARPREPGEERQELKLSEAAQTLLDECRMVLPGIQALFGFQLIAVFNARFARELDGFEQALHLCAVGLVACAVALVMTPAAMHRHYGGREVTDTFIAVSSLLLLSSMVPLAAGISIDFYLIARLILGGGIVAAVLGALSFAAFVFAWMLFPRMHRLHRYLGRAAGGGRARARVP
jgi:uncharacterized protein DUF6328